MLFKLNQIERCKWKMNSNLKCVRPQWTVPNFFLSFKPFFKCHHFSFFPISNKCWKWKYRLCYLYLNVIWFWQVQKAILKLNLFSYFHPQRYINKNRVRYRYLDSRRGWSQKLAVFLSHRSHHLVVLFCITHSVCSKLPRFGH